MANYGQKKIHLDQWYTRDDWAQACVDDLLTEMPELRGRSFLEPSAGGGAFIRALEDRGQIVEGYDLEPRVEGITQADFLTDDIDCSGKVVIGNPPYGNASSLARSFVARAFEQGASHVAFLLMGSYLRSPLIKTSREISYWKTIRPKFIASDGTPLSDPNKHWASWIVFSSGELQQSNNYLFATPYSNAEVFWAQGKPVGTPKECAAEAYVKSSNGYYGWVSRADGKRVLGKAFKTGEPLPKDRSVLEMISYET